ncbi:Caspase recruitment domain, member 6 [Mycoblastus sanguinarius]|nr:Caspase recruitment domain, member 6 [Mycoblastus sanguinarius]
MKHMLGLELYDHSQGWTSAFYVNPEALYRPRTTAVPTATVASTLATTQEPSYPTPWVWSVEFLESSGFNLSESMPAILEVVRVDGVEYVKESRTFAAPQPPSQPTSSPSPPEKSQKAFEKILDFWSAVFLFLFDQLNLLNWYLIRQTPLHSAYWVVRHLKERDYQRAKRMLLAESVSMEEALISSKAEFEGNYTSLAEMYIRQQGENQNLQARVLELEADNVRLSNENSGLHLDIDLRDEQIAENSLAHERQMEAMERQKEIELDAMSEKIKILVARIEEVVSQRDQSERDKRLAEEIFTAEIERLNSALSERTDSLIEKEKILNQVELEKAAMAKDLSRQIERLTEAKKIAQENSVAEINRLQEAVDRATDAPITKDQALSKVVHEKEALISELASRAATQSETEKEAGEERSVAETARFQRALDENNEATNDLTQEIDTLKTDPPTSKSDNTKLAEEEKETQVKIDKGPIARLGKEMGETQPSSLKEAEEKDVQQQQQLLTSKRQPQPKPTPELQSLSSSLNAAAPVFAPSSPRPKRPVPPLLPCHQAYQAATKLNPSWSQPVQAVRPPPRLVQPTSLWANKSQTSWVPQTVPSQNHQLPMGPSQSPMMHWAPPTEPRAMRERREQEQSRGISPQAQLDMQPPRPQQSPTQKAPPTEPRAMRERRQEHLPSISPQAQVNMQPPRPQQSPTQKLPPTEPRAMRERREQEQSRGISPQAQVDLQPPRPQQSPTQKLPPTEPRAMRERREQEYAELQATVSLQAQAIVQQPQPPQTRYTSPSPSPSPSQPTQNVALAKSGQTDGQQLAEQGRAPQAAPPLQQSPLLSQLSDHGAEPQMPAIPLADSLPPSSELRDVREQRELRQSENNNTPQTMQVAQVAENYQSPPREPQATTHEQRELQPQDPAPPAFVQPQPPAPRRRRHRGNPHPRQKPPPSQAAQESFERLQARLNKNE